MSLATRANFMLHYGLRKLRGQSNLPDFLLLGAQKAGPTSLYNYICRSPEVFPSLRKEVHYFSKYRLPNLSWYETFFPTNPGNEVGGFATGEATPFYLFHPDAPRRIADSGIAPKFIVILRCPVDRAWSHYRHEKRKNREPLPFEQALLAEPERLRGTTGRVLDRAHQEALQRHSYLARGQYMSQINRFLRYFDERDFLFLSLDHLRSDPATVVARSCEFLGVAPPPLDQPYPVYNAGKEKSGMPRVDPRIFLNAFDADLSDLVSILPEAHVWRDRLHA